MLLKVQLANKKMDPWKSKLENLSTTRKFYLDLGRRDPIFRSMAYGGGGLHL